jgi:glycosyltransferase involved in cell wall biosynthesis
MKFSICIPNYNYERYFGATLRSVVDQSYPDLEILVSDNASTDGSVDVVKRMADPRIKLNVNPCNLGFAANLDCAARMATGERMILLSSDDLMEREALATYAAFLDALPDGGPRVIVSSAQHRIDSDGVKTGRLGMLPPPFLVPGDRAASIEALVGAPVYRVAAAELLRRCVLAMRNPFHFATTMYPRRLYEAVGGYGGGRVVNPDKWFHWRLLSLADEAYFIDRTLFSYRWHASNQAALEKKSGALKFLVDEYLSTIELSNQALAAIGLSRPDLERAFVEYDIGRHGWGVLARESAYEARRIYDFGRATYPQHLRRNLKAQLLRLVLPFGGLARRLASTAYAARSKRVPTNEQPVSLEDERAPLSASSGG